MNWNEQDLTAYALGELSREQELALREELAANPQASGELAEMEAVTDALQHGAPVPMARLSDQQREAILRPAQMPRFVKPMMPRQIVRPQPSRWAAVPGALARLAAAACIAAGAFYLGQRFGGTPGAGGTQVAGVKREAEPRPSVAAAGKAAPLLKAAPVEPIVAISPEPPRLARPNEQAAAPVAAAAAAVKIAEVEIAAAPAPKPATAPHAPAVPGAAPVVSTLPENSGFLATAKQDESVITIRPYDTRPLPAKAKPGELMASPAVLQKSSVAPKSARKERAPELLIHSWKAEVAACPWDESHRLLRVLVQLPADQAAAASPEFNYPLKVEFDSAAVRSHRLLSEHHARPENGDATAAHVLWYEIVPARALAESQREMGRSVAAIKLADARFSSQKVWPFEDTQLLAMDRGSSWRTARQDFVFETAIVGFKLLLQGKEGLGSLDLDLVNELARHAAGENPSAEAAKFIRVVQEAKRATGL